MTPECFDKAFKYRSGNKFGRLPALSLIYEVVTRELRQDNTCSRKIIPIYWLYNELGGMIKKSEEELDKEFSFIIVSKGFTYKLKTPTSDIHSKDLSSIYKTNLKETDMPVPKKKQKEYGTIVASQTARLEKKGLGKKAANTKAKAMADKAIKPKKKGKKK